MTDIDYATRVAKGVALLDVKEPGWADLIDLERLDVENGYHCVTAQLSGMQSGEDSWLDGMEALGLTSGDRGTYVAHGFNADSLEQGEQENPDYDLPAAYATLNALWKGVIAERRAAADTPTEGAS